MLTVRTTRDGDVTVVIMDGSIVGGEEADAVRRTVNQLLQDGSSKLVLDMAAVDFIDSMGLCELVAAFSAAKKSGGGLRIAQMSGQLQEVLRLTRLTTVLEIFDTTQDACDSFREA